MRAKSLTIAAGTCLCISVLGWLVLVGVAEFMPGGHPPLSALVAIPVILGGWFFNGLGVLLAGVALKSATGHRVSGWVLLFGNLGMLAFGIIAWTI